MPVSHILVMLNGQQDAQAVRRTILAAYDQAASPVGLRFALPDAFQAALTAEDEANAELPQSSLLFYEDNGRLDILPSLTTEESFFLSLLGEYDFAAMWDKELLSRFGKVEYHALMTGSIGPASDGLEPQAYLPAFTKRMENNRVQIERGLPLVNSTAPVHTMVADPGLLFGRVSLLRKMELNWETLSLAAHVSNIPVYVLDRPVLWPVKELPVRWLDRPTPEMMKVPNVARFERLAGLSREPGALSLRYEWGLFNATETYPQKLPATMALRGRIRSLLSSREEPSVPHLISAFIDLPDAPKPEAVYMLRFTYLNALENLPLTLYTGGRCERYLRGLCTNARSYPERAVLPRDYLKRKMTEKDHLGRSKWLLMRKTAIDNPSYSHVAWINMDMLHYPICPDVLPDFSPLMDDRIHLALVDGVPDASFIVAPVHRLGLIGREVESMSQFDLEVGRSLTEEALIQRLYDRYSDLFALHPMPKKHLLFHWVLDRRLVDARHRALLAKAGEVQRADSVKIHMDGKEVEL
ncbi:MAG: hypothetical protein J6K73_08780 [Clostridia bacterium]|nr:hypothetical protein [Clostridia bacterium]